MSKNDFFNEESQAKEQDSVNDSDKRLTETQVNQEKQVAAEKKSKITTQTIVYTALFTAMAVVANAYLTIRVGQLFKFSVVLTVYFLAGYFLGAIPAFCVGFIGDLLGWCLFTDGAYNPIIGLANGLSCLIPALVFGVTRPVKQTSLLAFIVKALIAYVACYILCTVFITSTGIWVYTSYIQGKYENLIAWYVYRAGAQGLNTLANLILSIFISVAFSKISIYRKNKKTSL